MGDFITNRGGKFLSEIITSILPNAQNASFLVGYFYFSGFAEIYQGLKGKNLRILVGLEIEQDMINRVREVEHHVNLEKSRIDIKVILRNKSNYRKNEIKTIKENFLWF